MNEQLESIKEWTLGEKLLLLAVIWMILDGGVKI